MNAIELRQVTVASKQEIILDDISLKIPNNTIQLIIGPSGAGKTTLLKTMLGLTSYSGTIVCHPDANLGYIPQHLGLVKELDALTNVLLGSCKRVKDISLFSNIEEVNIAKQLLHDIGLGNRLHTKVKVLSGGEKRRIAVARAFLQRPDILFADEMLSDLDFYKIGQLTNMLRKMKNETQMTIVMVEHDLKIAKTLGDNIAFINSGKLKVIPKKTSYEKLMQYFTT